MANWTGAQLAAAVLTRLGVTGAGQSGSAEDTAVVTDAYNSIYPQLRRLGLAPWTQDAIEEEAQLPLCKYVAAQVATAFGVAGEQGAMVRMDGTDGFRELRQQASSDRSPLPIRNLYY